MVDDKDMTDENMKECMREIAPSFRNDIKETLKDVMITKKKERKIDLTPNSQLEPITQDTPQQTPRDEQLNNLIEEIEIEKSPNKRKTPTSSEEIQNQEDQEAIEITSESASKTKASTRKSRQKKTLQKGKKQVE